MWVTLDDNIVDHPKMLTAATYAGRHGLARVLAVYVAGLCFANKHLTDGFLPNGAVSTMKVDRNSREIAEILARSEVNLWEKVSGGYMIHDYHDRNPKANDIKEKRARDRDRKRAERGRQTRSFTQSVRADSPALARARSGSLDPDPVQDHAALRASPVENSGTDDGGRVLRALVWADVRAAWKDGPPAGGFSDLVEALKCKAARAGLIYGVDTFAIELERAVDRCEAAYLDRQKRIAG